MPENVSKLIGRGTRTFGALSLVQKVVTVATVLALVVGGYLFLGWVSKPTYAPLYTDLQAKDASAIVDQLNSTGVPYQLANGGSTVMVPKEKVYATRLALSGKGVAPSAGSTGWGLLDKQGITTSKFQQQVAYQRALEGELVNTIEALDGVTGAVVHLALPDKTVFTTETDPAKASVLVSTSPGHDLTSGQVQAVVNLVSSSVDNLKPADVTVADSAGRVLSASTDGSAGAVADSRAQQTRDYETRVQDGLQAMIDRVVGPGHSEVRLTADLDYDQTKTTTETYKNSATLPLAGSTTTEKYTGTGGTAGGVLGSDNIAVPSGGGTGNYSKTTTTNNNALDRTVEERTAAPGAVRKLNVAVLLDSATAGKVNTAQIQSLVSSAVGLNPTRGDSVVVSALPFDTTAATTAAAELKAAAKAKSTATRNHLITTAGKWALVLLVLGFVLLTLRRTLSRAGRAAEDRREIEALQRELAARDSLALPGGGGAASLPTAHTAGELPGPRAPAELETVNTSDPDEVAQLLRGWLSEPHS